MHFKDYNARVKGLHELAKLWVRSIANIGSFHVDYLQCKWQHCSNCTLTLCNGESDSPASSLCDDND